VSFKLLVHAWDAEVPTQSHRLVLMKLVDCCDDDGRNIFPKMKTVAAAAKCSHRHAQRVVAEFCRIGLLRRVKEGGRGQDSAAHYEMDLEMLTRLRRAEMYPALLAAAKFEPLGEEGDDDLSDAGDEAASHAPGACDEPRAEADSAISKGDTRSPLEPSRVTWETAKGDKLCHPHREPLNNPSVEREGARAQVGMPASEGEPDAGHASGEGQNRPPATLADFRAAYPHAGADDQAQLATAWEALRFAERWPAIDGIPGFLAERKAAGLTSRLSAPKYLSGRNWLHVPQKAAQRESAAQASAPVVVSAWSRDWWLLLHDRIRAGRSPSLWVQQAESGKAMSSTGAEIAAAGQRIGALQPYRCDGPEIEAWRDWLRVKGARIPPFRGEFRVFLPGPTPPGGKAEAGDDEVRL